MAKEKLESSGPLSGHLKVGRKFTPELLAFTQMQIGDWTRDDLPDLIWPALCLAHNGDHAARNFVEWQKSVFTKLASSFEADHIGSNLDGRLTSLDRLAGSFPLSQKIIRSAAQEHGLLDEPIVRALASYPEIPARWLIERIHEAPGQAEVNLLERSVREAVADGHREALLKCISIWGRTACGTFRSDQRTMDLLANYPKDRSKKDQTDSVIRAVWGAHRGSLLHSDPSCLDQSIRWAKIFWGCNSMTTACLRRRDVDEAPEQPNETVSGPTTDSGMPINEVQTGGYLEPRVMDLMSSYVEALERSPARLYDPEMQEVHAGLVMQLGRNLAAVLSNRDMWCMEHGAQITRSLVEVEIYLRWMALQDPSIYTRFKDYGAGKAKLYAHILNEIPSDWRTRDFDDALDQMLKLSHNDFTFDIREVDTADSFSGISLRKMAEESGMLDYYRRAYQLSSGISHFEWWALENHAMERCLNTLHRGHFIPRLTISTGNVQLAHSWVAQFYSIIRMSLSALNADKDCVDQAFSWLNKDEG